MRKPISAADHTPVRVVVVTMDSHLGGALTRAETTLRRELPNLDVTMHAADEWGSDPAALAACHADIAEANIVIATMLFLEDHIRAVLPALAARRDHCDAMICMLSAGEVVKLTRVGKFNMSTEATGAIAWLKRMRGKGGTGSNARGQMKMLRQIPKLLRFIPGTAQDVRAYFMALQYWLAGSEENLGGMVRLLVGRYAAGDRAPPGRFAARRAAGGISRGRPVSSSRRRPHRGTAGSASDRRTRMAASVCCCCDPMRCRATPRIMTA